jgi:predicted nucleotidyltransferase component of viral defense system
MNSREHFSVMGLVNRPFAVDNAWFRGEASITTYALEELLGTKLRALYQCRKGRDLFDLWLALTAGGADPDAVLTCFRHYMEDSDSVPTRAVFEENVFEKASRQDFRGDMDALLRPSVSWNFDEALAVVLETLIARLPGAPWKRAGSDAGR